MLSGRAEDIQACCQEAGLTQHTYLHSLDLFGTVKDLPSEDELSLITMCGHGLVASARVKHLVERIRKGKLTPKKAAEDIARPCVCGIVNKQRAEEIFSRLASSCPERDVRGGSMTDGKQEKTVAYFSRWAKTYDEGPLQRWFTTVHREVIRAVDPQPTDNILDVACGTGKALRAMAALATSGRLAGLDMSEKMIEEARSHRQRHLESRIPVGSADCLPFEDETFDHVTTMNAFHHFPDQRKSVQEMVRVLEKGGPHLHRRHHGPRAPVPDRGQQGLEPDRISADSAGQRVEPKRFSPAVPGARGWRTSSSCRRRRRITAAAGIGFGPVGFRSSRGCTGLGCWPAEP